MAYSHVSVKTLLPCELSGIMYRDPRKKLEGERPPSLSFFFQLEKNHPSRRPGLQPRREPTSAVSSRHYDNNMALPVSYVICCRRLFCLAMATAGEGGMPI